MVETILSSLILKMSINKLLKMSRFYFEKAIWATFVVVSQVLFLKSIIKRTTDECCNTWISNAGFDSAQTSSRIITCAPWFTQWTSAIFVAHRIARKQKQNVVHCKKNQKNIDQVFFFYSRNKRSSCLLKLKRSKQTQMKTAHV